MSRRRADGPDGLVVVDKPAGMTSHDVVAVARKALGTGRVGHSGTLDPDATGVLLLGVGRVTRLLRFLTDLPKTYEGEVVFGVETSTLDSAGEVTATHDMGGLSVPRVEAAAAGFVGEIEQIPPMVSAVRVDGRRLHEIAREGGEVERKARTVTIHSLAVWPTGDALVFGVRLTCSSGTYVRTLAADLGAALGGGAHLRSLRRRSIGSFGLGEACTLDGLGLSALRAPAVAMRDYPEVLVSNEVATDVGFGKVLPPDRLGVEGDGPWAVLDRSECLLAVYQRHEGGTVKPAVVLQG